MRTFDGLASMVDAAFPLLQSDTDFCQPDCYPLPLPFPMLPLLDVRGYRSQEPKDFHAQADCL